MLRVTMDSNTPSSSTDSAEKIDIEQTTWIADILRNRRRVQVLLELESVGDEGLSVGELVDRLAERDHGAGFSSDERRRIFVALYQTHVQTLDASDVLEVERDVCTRGGRFNEVVSALHRLQE